MQYDPKLKKAMEEIKEILDKYDIGASVILHTPPFSEYFVKVNPSYSCAFIQGDQLRIKSDLQHDYNGDKEAQLRKLADTANLITHLADVSGQVSISLFDMLDLLKSKFQLYDIDRDSSSHSQQNN